MLQHPVRTRVMLVDDVADLRVMLRAALDADPRFEVVAEAANGVEAIEIARQALPDLILLDVAMPDMDGISAIPLLHEAVPNVRIVMFSGFADKRTVEESLTACATAFVDKGTPLLDVIDIVAKVYQTPPKLCSDN